MSKGAMEYFSAIATTLASMFSVLFILVIGTIVLFFVVVKVNVEVFGNVVYEIPKNANSLISFMDITYDGHRIGDLFAYSVWKGDTKIEIEENDYFEKCDNGIGSSSGGDFSCTKPDCCCCGVGYHAHDLGEIISHADKIVINYDNGGSGCYHAVDNKVYKLTSDNWVLIGIAPKAEYGGSIEIENLADFSKIKIEKSIYDCYLDYSEITVYGAKTEIDLQELSLKDFFKDEAGYKLVFELNGKEYEIDSFGNIDKGTYSEVPILAGNKHGKLKLWSRLYL